MERYSVIDLGSNTIRLVAYDVRTDQRSIEKYRNADRSKLFKDAVNEKKTVGLATYVEDGIFTDQGLDKAESVLTSFLAIAENVNSDRTQIFATAVLRNCKNSKAAVEELERRTKVKIDLLSAYDEAHLGYIGATCTTPATSGTLIDIGGGSTELTSLTETGDKHHVSISAGSISSYKKNVELILPSSKEIKKIAEDFDKRLSSLKNIKDYESDVLYGIGGSIRAVSKIGGLIYGNGNKLKEVTLDQVDGLFDLLGEDPSKFAHLAVRAVPDRLHSLVPGATILRCCMRKTGASKISVRKYGLREGYLLDRMLHLD